MHFLKSAFLNVCLKIETFTLQTYVCQLNRKQFLDDNQSLKIIDIWQNFGTTVISPELEVNLSQYHVIIDPVTWQDTCREP